MRPRRCPSRPCPGCPVCRPLPRLPRRWPAAPPRPSWDLLATGLALAPLPPLAPARLYLAPDGSPLRVEPSPDAPLAPYAAQPGPAAPRMAPAPTGPVLARRRAVDGWQARPLAPGPFCQYPAPWLPGPGPARGPDGRCPGCAECDNA